MKRGKQKRTLQRERAISELQSARLELQKVTAPADIERLRVKISCMENAIYAQYGIRPNDPMF